MSNKNGLKILICGSSNFDDSTFVCGLLDKLQEKVGHENMGSIISGPFSGTSKFAREWAKDNKVQYISHNFFNDTTYELFDEKAIPEFVINSDPIFLKEKDNLMSYGVNMVIPFPNRTGKYGVTTSNILRLSQSMGLKVLPGEEAYQKISEFRKERNAQLEAYQEKVKREKANHRKNLASLKII